jgi:acetaldehyde dehydrogenase (acetylating)
MKTVGVVRRDDTQGHRDRRAVRRGRGHRAVHQPTSTAIYKILIAIKARCAIVISPHPSAARCITRTAEIMARGGPPAGLPDGAIGWMTTVTLEGTQELMRQREVSVILATGGMGLVRAAYSAGKPAYGVGPGNAPCYIESSADVAKAAATSSPARRSTTACSARRRTRWWSTRHRREARRAVAAHGGTSCRAPRRRAGPPGHAPAAAEPGARRQVGGAHRAEAGIAVPPGTRALLAELDGVGRDFPLSIEKLCPVLSYYVSTTGARGASAARQILRYGGMGHTMSIHSRNDAVILEFGLHKPAFRIVRQHADHARVDRTHDGPRPGDDARVRRLRRQHHVGQHLAAAPAEHQAAGLDRLRAVFFLLLSASHAGPVRLRRRRPGSRSGGPENSRGRAHHHHARGTRCRRVGEGFHLGRMAVVKV